MSRPVTAVVLWTLVGVFALLSLAPWNDGCSSRGGLVGLFLALAAGTFAAAATVASRPPHGVGPIYLGALLGLGLFLLLIALQLADWAGNCTA
jgi:hypothetical protein